MVIIALLLLIVGQVSADQPVSCLRQQIHDQQWLFHVSQQNATLNLFEQEEVCTHGLPNRVQIIDKDHKFTFEKEDVWKIHIMSDFTALAKFCPDGNTHSCQEPVTGVWQTVYDQTLLVELQNSLRFIATFRYQLKKNVTKDYTEISKLIQGVDENAKANFNFMCDQTMVGFVQNRSELAIQSSHKEHKVTCMYAHKDMDQLYENQVAGPTKLQKISIASVNQTGDSAANQTSSSGSTHNSSLNATPANSGQQNGTSLSQPSQSGAKTVAKPVQQKSQTKKHSKKQKFASGWQKKGNMFATFQPTAASDSRIMEINSKNSTYPWRANECLLSKNHSQYDAKACGDSAGQQVLVDETERYDSEFVSKYTLAQAMSNLGLDGALGDDEAKPKAKNTQFKKNPRSGTKKFGEKTSDFQQAASKAQKFMREYKTADDIPDWQVPDSFDWRNIKGYDFTGNLRDQEECGSCYSFAFIQVTEARMKVKYAHKRIEQPDLSVQFIIQCNYMTEGCQGGWAVFDTFFAMNGGVPTEQCAPYQAVTKGHNCADYSHCEPQTRVLDARYVNGYNFSPTEMQIRKELMMNGPVTTEFKVQEDFFTYRNGTLVQDHPEPEKTYTNDLLSVNSSTTTNSTVNSTKSQSLSTKDINRNHDSKLQMAHQPLDHSIILIGWGVEKDKDGKEVPYWIARNSWGDRWGMNGDFHVRRGNDDFGIESEPLAISVELAEPQNADL